MARSPNSKANKAAAASSPTKATTGFGKAFSQIHNKTFASSPVKGGRVNTVDVDYEVLSPLGACLVTFSQHGKHNHAYVYPLLTALGQDPLKAYETLRIFVQATLFNNDTPDRKLKKNETHDVVGLVITFDQQEDNFSEANIDANLLKVVKTLVQYANNLARRPYNGEASDTFQFKNDFCVGTDYTRKPQERRRYLGLVISPTDSVSYMERIFDGRTFSDIVHDAEIMKCMYGTMEEGNALVAIARPGFVPREDGNEDRPNNDEPDGDLPKFLAVTEA
jgi:hypothetical protein